MIKKLLASSANPEKISLTLKSFVPFILTLAVMFGLKIDGTIIDEIIEGIVAIVSGIGILYGIGRKIYYALKK